MQKTGLAFLILTFVSCSNSNSPQTSMDMAPADMAPVLDPCTMACLQGQDTGTPLYQAFMGCIQNACSQYEPGSDQEAACINDAFDPSNPNAACRSMTDACFTGGIGGCKELADHVEKVCTPATLPISMEEMAQVAFCIIQEGWKGALSAQARAWPLYMCVFDDDPAGCLDECTGGGAACRACAQQKCGSLYDACMADSSTAVSTDLPADEASCQAIHACVLQCM